MKGSYLRAVGIGLIAGARSMVAPALVSRYVNGKEDYSLGAVGELMGSPIVSRALQAGAAAEMAADKSPWMPDRTAWPSLAWRAVAGGVAGSVVARTAGESRLVGALLAAAAAVAATYATFYLRREIRDRLNVPDRLLGAAEDSFVVGAGHRLLASA